MIDFRFDWSKEFETKIEPIDMQHKEFFEIGRDIEQLLQTNCIGVKDIQLLDIVNRLKEYTSYHFYGEEQLMLEAKYPKIEQHKEEHRKHTKKIAAISLPNLKEDPMFELVRIQSILHEIVFFHILSYDKEMGEFIVAAQSKKHTKKKVRKVDAFEEKYGLYVADLDVSRVYLTRDQRLPGRCLIIYKNSINSVEQLSALERSTLFSDIHQLTTAIKKAFQPDQFNSGTYSDVETQLHFHLVPKYKDKEFYGTNFPLETLETKLTTDDTLEELEQKKELLLKYL